MTSHLARLTLRPLGLSFLIALSALPRAAHAFPEMVRHGYTSCTTCHVSPTGGGNLSQYGRQLSKEVLSTWGRDGEPEFAYGMLPKPSWLELQGDYRNVYVYRNTPTYRDGRNIFMQADLSAAATAGPLTASASLGYQEGPAGSSFADQLVSSEHYLLYRVSDAVGVRAGKFRPALGINSPNHTLLTRRALRLNDEGSASYNLEASYQDERFGVFATLIEGRPDDPKLKRERGVSLVASQSLGESHKIGFSYYSGAFGGARREVLGPWAILGFTPHFYLLTETDVQITDTASGFATSNRLAYEVVQGVHPYFQQELGRLDFANPGSLLASYGIGAQLFPRPHFALDLIWQKRKSAQAYDGFTDYAYLMFHFYL